MILIVGFFSTNPSVISDPFKFLTLLFNLINIKVNIVSFFCQLFFYIILKMINLTHIQLGEKT